MPGMKSSTGELDKADPLSCWGGDEALQRNLYKL